MSTTDYVHLLSDKAWAGKNSIDWRATWVLASQMEQIGVFNMPNGALVRGEWVMEGGDNSLPPAEREPRILAQKGKLRLLFTGTNLTIRVGLNPSWGVGQVYIDGIKPSAIAGVTKALDTFSCDSAAHGSWGNEYIDIQLVDGLSNTQHVLEIYCNNAAKGAGGFVVVTGCKIFSQSNVSREVENWIVSRTEMAQAETLRVKNMGGRAVTDVQLKFPDTVVSDTGAALGTVVLGDIPSNAEKSVVMVPNLKGTETAGLLNVPIELSATYSRDSDTASGAFVPQQVGLTYTGTWSNDTTFGEVREYSSTKGASIAFSVNAREFNLRVQRDFGWGTFLVLINPLNVTCGITNTSPVVTVPAAAINQLAVGMVVTGTNLPALTKINAIDKVANTITLSANATATNAARALKFETQLTTVTCNDVNGGSFFVDVKITGLTQDFGNLVRIAADSTKPCVWSRIWWQGIDITETVVEQLVLNVKRKHIQPFPIKNVRLENGQIAWTPGAANAVDLSKPFDNRGVVREEVAARFPTFLVIYQPGYQETIKQYDVAVIDPFGTTRKQVAELQALGIQVIVYVSFGEEDGTLKDKWDPSSQQVPWVGDGAGPGGYASYYMKAGYGYGEQSECTHDCQRVDGTKRCAVNNPKYNPNWSGRCTAACSKDWRQGYSSWQSGAVCGGGYTSSNNWQRDASKACTNSKCPKYTPANTKCTQYKQAEVWGQDFSVNDNFPDENGIWSSYYVNPIDRGPNSWYARIRDYYLPLIFGQPQVRDEVSTVVKKVLDPADLVSGTVLGLELLHAPVDEDEPLSISDIASGYVYQQGIEWDMDFKLGIVKLHPQDKSPVIAENGQLRVQYSTKGLAADGVFMDTVDTVDIYPKEPYQQGAADLINDMKKLYPNKAFCSNRGFTILDRIIHSCSYVMFESFLTDYNWDTGVYGKVSPESAAWNDEITKQLYDLRRNNVFDVLALNYCSNGPAGDELREYIRQEALKRGWLSWSSEILLNRPLDNKKFTDNTGPIRTNNWRTYRVKRK